MTLRTQGSVGLDQSLDLVAELAVNPALADKLGQPPLLKRNAPGPHPRHLRPSPD